MMSYSPTRKRNRLLPRSGAIATAIFLAGFSASSYKSEITVEANSASKPACTAYGLLFVALPSVGGWFLFSVANLRLFLLVLSDVNAIGIMRQSSSGVLANTVTNPLLLFAIFSLW